MIKPKKDIGAADKKYSPAGTWDKLPINTFWGLPINVQALPIFEAIATASK